MQISDLLAPERIQLGVAAGDKAAAIRYMVGLLYGSGCLTDAGAFERDVLAREGQSTTGVGGGVAIPHGKSAAVTAPALACVTLCRPIDFAALDGAPVSMIFMIAVPPNADDLHIGVLAQLARLLMDADLRAALGSAQTPQAVLDLLTAGEGEAAPAAPAASHYRVLAVTACPTGIAHTYMAAEALEGKAAEMGISLKVETDGADGIHNALTPSEIAGADCIILAIDRAIETARFAGRPLFQVPVAEALRNPEGLLQRAVSGAVPRFVQPLDPPPVLPPSQPSSARRDPDVKALHLRVLGRRAYNDLMNGISHMIPFITGGGILIALSYFLDRANVGEIGFGSGTSMSWLVRMLGDTAFTMIYPVLAGFIAVSIGETPALLPGMVGGLLAYQGVTVAESGSWVSSGFWGALFAGFFAGLMVRWLRRLFARLPQAISTIKATLLYPFISLTVVGLVMILLINPPLGRFNEWLYQGLNGMQGGSRILLGAVLGAMMAVDFGGPMNKAAYLFGTVAILNDQTQLMAAVMLGGMVPPIGVALASNLFPDRFTVRERQSCLTNYLMGISFITEGALPYALRDPLRFIPACMVGSGLAGALAVAWGAGMPAPHGGLYLLPLADHPLAFLAALAIGSVVTALLLGLFRPRLQGKEDAENFRKGEKTE